MKEKRIGHTLGNLVGELLEAPFDFMDALVNGPPKRPERQEPERKPKQQATSCCECCKDKE